MGLVDILEQEENAIERVVVFSLPIFAGSEIKKEEETVSHFERETTELYLTYKSKIQVIAIKRPFGIIRVSHLTIPRQRWVI
jgi:hypothetical protein